MNGLELHKRIETLTYELEKYPKLSLAHVLVVEILTKAAYGITYSGRGDTAEARCDIAAADLKEQLREMSRITRGVYANRRLERLMKQLDDPKPKRKRQRKKRRTRRGL